ncbi:MAG: DUF302 domain-containing protein [Prolixibacteraceae bacterium]|nr:DUF302 domain-containing protein [Prolixibacteraceae bacterium]
MFLAGLFSGFVLIGLFLVFVFPRLMFSVNESKYDFNETVEKLTESTKSNNWKMPHEYDLQQIMTNNGFTVRPVKVFSICKPDIAVRILGNDKHRQISALMPCRVAVYEKADGKTYVSRMNAELFARLLGGEATAIMSDAGEGSENILKALVKK